MGGFELIQSWQSFVYHLTARGGQFQHGKLTKDHSQKSEEWQKLMENSTREFFRKWSSSVNHDEFMMPTISPKFDIGFVVHNIHNYNVLHSLEPWCSTFYGDFPKDLLPMYIRDEQSNTTRNLKEKVQPLTNEKNNDILVEFDSVKLTNESFNFLTQLPMILKDSGEIGEMEYDIFKITINSLKTYNEDLIVNEDTMFNTN